MASEMLVLGSSHGSDRPVFASADEEVNGENMNIIKYQLLAS